MTTTPAIDASSTTPASPDDADRTPPVISHLGNALLTFVVCSRYPFPVGGDRGASPRRRCRSRFEPRTRVEHTRTARYSGSFAVSPGAANAQSPFHPQATHAAREDHRAQPRAGG